jgi:AraC-like DNA-binding protein
MELISQGWSSKAVANELNFSSGSHFCHEFKKLYGVSPQSFAPLFGTQGNRVANLRRGADKKKA